MKQAIYSKINSKSRLHVWCYCFRAMAFGTSEINKMDQSIEPSKVSSPAAEGNKLGTGDTLEDQITTPEEKMKNTRNKRTIHDEQKASSTINIDNSRIPRTNSISHEDGSSCHLLSGVVANLKLPTEENGMSAGMANNCKLAPSTILSANYITNCVAQRQHYSMTNDETLTPLQDLATSDPGSRFCKNYPEMEKNCGNIFSTNLLNMTEGSGVTENKFKGKGTHAVGASVAAYCVAEAFNGESSNDMKNQGRIISATVDVNPGAEKDESLPSTKPTTRCSSTKDKSKSGSVPPKKLRKCEASVLTGPNSNNKPSDITGETDDDHKELLVAAGSVHSIRENACSFPFWKTMESFFAPVTSQDIFFLKQELNFVENLTQSQIFGDEYDRPGGISSSPRREVSNSDQQSITSTAFGRSNKPSNIVPPLLQRVLSAFVNEDGGSDPHCCERVEFELQPELDMQAQKYSSVYGLCSNKSASTYSTGSMLSPNDKLSLEPWSIGLNAPLLDSREGWIDREIKRLRGELWQKVSMVKNNLRKIGKAIKCEQDLEKRNLEESAMDQLVEMAYKRMFQGGWRSKSSRIRKVSERAALPFVKRTLARCKQFEDSGKSIFGQHDLLSSILYKPSTEKDPRPIECDGSMILDNKCKRAHGKAKRKCSEIGPALGAIQRLDSQNNNMQRGSSGLQETSTPLDPVKILGETEDLSSLLKFDEEGLLDGDRIGLDVPIQKWRCFCNVLLVKWLSSTFLSMKIIPSLFFCRAIPD
ncbi:uncharacterized protein LOC113757805 [Coffea eugenioides]|uniref:uncharacterized protein LOC113757805 n=1 Tax=Coffea eugenioides TaxID=49369 RepID=UPI000F6095A5|nr:uncharacterized protein LOC113757805 [Coffea eugenioides]